MTAVRLLQAFFQDVKYALRTLHNAPAFTLTAISLLALGIGANSAMFSVVRAVLLTPLPYVEPERLVRISLDDPRHNTLDVGFSLARFETLGVPRSFTRCSAFFIATENMALSGDAGPESVKVARVSANFLDVLGVAPMLGRSFRSDEDTPGASPVAMISAELWRRRFDSATNLLGKAINLDATAHTVVGVLPARFAFPATGVDIWVTKPAEFSALPPPVRRTAGILIGLARLRSRVTLEQARAELNVLNQQYALAHPNEASGTSLRAAFFGDRLVANVRPVLWMLLGAVGFVLLIACANLGGLQLARATFRSREYTIRASLGAARSRLVAQSLAESLLLALAGGTLGLLLAQWCLSAVRKASMFDLPRSSGIRLDVGVLAATAVISLGTGILLGLLPSFEASRVNLPDVLQERGVGSAEKGLRRGALGWSSRGLLVVVQIALALVLLVGASLLAQSIAKLQGVELGFEPANVLTMQIALPRARYDARREQEFFGQILRRIETIRGVRAAAVAQTLPMTARYATPIAVVEQPPVKFNERPQAQLQTVTPGYFRALGIARRRGREFTASDGRREPYVVIINEALARRFWPAYPAGPNPLGQHLLLGANPKPTEIEAIVADVRERNADTEAMPEVYVPLTQNALQTASLIVRTTSEPLGMVNSVRSQVLAVDRDQAVSSIQTMEHVVEASIGRRRVTLLLLASFAGVGMFLAVIGIYGVIAYSAAQRAREIGIRCALGAQRRDILRLVLGQGLALASAGVVLGILAAYSLTRILKTLLFRISATDSATFAAAALSFLLAAAAASYVPARRALTNDPAAALR